MTQKKPHIHMQAYRVTQKRSLYNTYPKEPFIILKRALYAIQKNPRIRMHIESRKRALHMTQKRPTYDSKEPAHQPASVSSDSKEPYMRLKRAPYAI